MLVHPSAAPVRKAPQTVAAVPPGRGWRVVFQDYFNGKSLNRHKWATCWNSKLHPTFACTNYQEGELYRAANVTVSHGVLQLTARKQLNKPKGWGTYHYTSGMITTSGLRSFRYGAFQTRIKLPRGSGLWTTFWLLQPDGSWPPEFDLMEHYGKSPTKIMMAYHWGRYQSWNNPQYYPRSVESAWHTYTVVWEPKSIRWYIDGKLTRSFSGRRVSSRKMALYLTFAVNKSNPYAGYLNRNTHFPATVYVKYVRVWQKK
jgi:beta-glucanase (GH16 family)